jgi:hypothetical protein
LELEVTVAVSSEFLVGDSHGKFVNSWRLKVWLEGVIHV